MQVYRLYVGTGEDKDHNAIEDVATKLQQCASFLSRVFGGCSILSATGYWQENKDYTAKEESAIFEIITDKPSEIDKASKMLKNVFNQNSVMVSHFKTNTSFV